MDPVRSNNGPRYKHLADEPAPYDTITIDKLTPIIGGEIGGVDLSRPLGNRTLDEIHRALAENLVIFFRDQHRTSISPLAGCSETSTSIRRRRMRRANPN